MVAPAAKDRLGLVLAPLDVVVVDAGIFFAVPLAHPVCALDLPVLEFCSIFVPLEVPGATTIIEPILRVLGSMNIEEDRDVAGRRPVHEFVDLLHSTVHAADVRAVLVDRPVADGEANTIDTFLYQLVHPLFIEPMFPVATHPSVSLGWVVKRLAECVRIDANSVIARLSEELVK